MEDNNTSKSADKESVKSFFSDGNDSNESTHRELPPIRRPSRASLTKFQSFGRKVANVVGFGRKVMTRKPSGEGLSGIEENEAYSELRIPRVKEDFINVINLENLPRKPRFTSMLSAESQYAIFSGYDHLLHKMIVESDPDYAKLKQVAAPDIPDMTTNQIGFVSNRGVQVYAPQVENVASRKTSNVPARKTSSVKRSSTTTSPTQLRRLGSVDENSSISGMSSIPCTPGQDHLTSRTSVSSRKGSTLTRPQPRTSRIASIEPQIMSSYRLQNAMDICDYLRDQRGETVLTKRFERYYIEPQNHYILWSLAWKKDFEFKPRIISPEASDQSAFQTVS